MRGNATGIALSHCSIGDGVNADNIRAILSLLRDTGYAGTLSMECQGAGGPMIEKSLAWLHQDAERAEYSGREITQGQASVPAPRGIMNIGVNMLLWATCVTKQHVAALKTIKTRARTAWKSRSWRARLPLIASWGACSTTSG